MSPEPTLFDPPRKHASHRMHRNSLEAWRGLDLGKRQAMVLAEYDAPRTDREVADRLGFADPNRVRPRVTELVKAGVLVEVGKRTQSPALARFHEWAKGAKLVGGAA